MGFRVDDLYRLRVVRVPPSRERDEEEPTLPRGAHARRRLAAAAVGPDRVDRPHLDAVGHLEAEELLARVLYLVPNGRPRLRLALVVDADLGMHHGHVDDRGDEFAPLVRREGQARPVWRAVVPVAREDGRVHEAAVVVGDLLAVDHAKRIVRHALGGDLQVEAARDADVAILRVDALGFDAADEDRARRAVGLGIRDEHVVVAGDLLPEPHGPEVAVGPRGQEVPADELDVLQLLRDPEGELVHGRARDVVPDSDAPVGQPLADRHEVEGLREDARRLLLREELERPAALAEAVGDLRAWDAHRHRPRVHLPEPGPYRLVEIDPLLRGERDVAAFALGAPHGDRTDLPPRPKRRLAELEPETHERAPEDRLREAHLHLLQILDVPHRVVGDLGPLDLRDDKSLVDGERERPERRVPDVELDVGVHEEVVLADVHHDAPRGVIGRHDVLDGETHLVGARRVGVEEGVSAREVPLVAAVEDDPREGPRVHLREAARLLHHDLERAVGADRERPPGADHAQGLDDGQVNPHGEVPQGHLGRYLERILRRHGPGERDREPRAFAGLVDVPVLNARPPHLRHGERLRHVELERLELALRHRENKKRVDPERPGPRPDYRVRLRGHDELRRELLDLGLPADGKGTAGPQERLHGQHVVLHRALELHRAGEPDLEVRPVADELELAAVGHGDRERGLAPGRVLEDARAAGERHGFSVLAAAQPRDVVRPRRGVVPEGPPRARRCHRGRGVEDEVARDEGDLGPPDARVGRQAERERDVLAVDPAPDAHVRHLDLGPRRACGDTPERERDCERCPVHC